MSYLSATAFTILILLVTVALVGRSVARRECKESGHLWTAETIGDREHLWCRRCGRGA